MHVNDVTGSDTVFPEPRIVTRGQWTSETLEAYRPLFTDLATSLGQATSDLAEAAETGDPLVQMLAGLEPDDGAGDDGHGGRLDGRLARQARVRPARPADPAHASKTSCSSAATIDRFAAEWEIPVDEMRLWVLAHELSGFQIFSIAHLRDALADLVRTHVGGFRPDPTAIADKLGVVRPVLRRRQRRSDAGDPADCSAIPRCCSAPSGRPSRWRCSRASTPPSPPSSATPTGWSTPSPCASSAARRCASPRPCAANAPRPAADDVFVERLLGIRLGDDQVPRGKSFVQGVVDRVGEPGLTRLLALPDSLPTPNEIDAPGLWIARVGDSDVERTPRPRRASRTPLGAPSDVVHQRRRPSPTPTSR